MILSRRTLLAATAAGAVAPLPAFAQDKVLRVVPHANLAILDPMWTTAYISRNHGYMVYDTLFGTDEHGVVKPQMVERWSVSPDSRLWTFTLRKGLEFHDGKPVTGDDVVASLARWGKRDAMGTALMLFVQRMDSPSPDSFRLFLREACGFVLDALGKPSSNVPFIMPRRVAETDPFKQIDEYVGSGPFIFRKDDFKPGDKSVYLKNPRYVPRDEPASGSAGGKRVYVDRVEWNLALRDPQSALNALRRGEIDIIEQISFDHYATVKADPELRMPRYATLGQAFFARFNHLARPFDNVKVRRAAMAAFAQQEPFLRAQVGVKELYKTCYAMFTCGTPLATNAGSEVQAKMTMRQAQQLLKDSGYDGTTIVVLKPTDLVSINKLPDVATQLLRQAGFKVDLQAMDWATLQGRRAKKAGPEQGGWNMFLSAWQAFDIWNPISSPMMDTRGDKSPWFGWGSDDKMVELRAQYLRALDLPTKKKLAEAIQVRAYETAQYVPLGEMDSPMATSKAISGVFISNLNVYWNVKKD